MKACDLAQVNLTSSDTRPIKATRTALEIIKANEKSIENSKTGKVTAVVAILKVFSRTLAIPGTLAPEENQLNQIID